MSATLTAIGCGLATALCFGTGDYLAQRLTRRHGWFVAVFGVQLLSGVILAVLALAWHGWPVLDEVDARAWLGLGAIGLANSLGLIGLYRAFESGKLTLVSPIAGSMGAFTVVFAWLAGSPPALVLVPGLGAVVLGILAASVVTGEVGEGEAAGPSAGLSVALGIGWALLSAVCFGWMLFVLGPSSELFGPAWVVAALRVVAVVTLLGLALVLNTELRGGLRALWGESRGRLALVVTLDSGGLLLYASASSRELLGGEVAVLAVLASSFPLVTIVLAQVRSSEELRWWQWTGIAAVLTGVAWISGWSGTN